MMIMIVLVLGLVAGLDVCFVDPRQTDGRTDGSSDNQAQPFPFLVFYNTRSRRIAGKHT